MAALCTRRPLATVVLHQHGVSPSDPRPLAACCRERGLEVASILDELTAEEDRLADPWRARPQTDLVDHVVETYHRPFATEVAAAATAITAVGPHVADPQRVEWSELGRELSDLGTDMVEHMAKEEQVLFPWLLGRAETAAAPIRAMQLEHADAISLLHALRTRLDRCLAAGPQRPAAHAVASRFEKLERTLCAHLHLENNVLFQRALDADLRR